MKLKRLVKELAAIKGRHTELVSVYVPSGGNLIDSINQLKNEQGTAANIKSKATRKNVLTALDKIIQHLRLFRSTPKNGLVAFAGNVSPVEGREDIRLWSFEPAEKMETKVYWCDQVFVLEPLQDLVKEKEVYGLIVLDAREANVAVLKGKRIVPLKHLESTVPSKTVKGGMSQGRYDRLREDAINGFLTKVGEMSSQTFLEQENLKGVIIGGPGPVKDRFADKDYLNYQLKNKLLGVKDIGYTGEYGLEELVKRSEDLLEKAAIMKERELMEKFFKELHKEGNVAYGYTEVVKALELNAVDILLVSEAFDWMKASLRCQNGHYVERELPKTAMGNQVCDVCKQKLEVQSEEELADALTERAANIGAKVELISVDTPEGKQFKELGGVGALLRFKLD